jgi:hypothetical protein
LEQSEHENHAAGKMDGVLWKQFAFRVNREEVRLGIEPSETEKPC